MYADSLADFGRLSGGSTGDLAYSKIARAAIDIP